MTFRDSGCGISEENLQRLFLNFSKLHETSDVNKQGVGLGLSICKQIVDLLGGKIETTSQLGRGTDFIIKLTSKCRIDE